jgi:hypothetical protein
MASTTSGSLETKFDMMLSRNGRVKGRNGRAYDQTQHFATSTQKQPRRRTTEMTHNVKSTGTIIKANHARRTIQLATKVVDVARHDFSHLHANILESVRLDGMNCTGRIHNVDRTSECDKHEETLPPGALKARSQTPTQTGTIVQ